MQSVYIYCLPRPPPMFNVSFGNVDRDEDACMHVSCSLDRRPPEGHSLISSRPLSISIYLYLRNPVPDLRNPGPDGWWRTTPNLFMISENDVPIELSNNQEGAQRPSRAKLKALAGKRNPGHLTQENSS
jgi:hypothetical protein